MKNKLIQMFENLISDVTHTYGAVCFEISEVAACPSGPCQNCPLFNRKNLQLLLDELKHNVPTKG